MVLPGDVPRMDRSGPCSCRCHRSAGIIHNVACCDYSGLTHSKIDRQRFSEPTVPALPPARKQKKE